MTWQELLSEALETRQGLGFQPQPACPESEIEALSDKYRRVLGMELPQEYKELLRRVNGFDWNGMVIYASRRGRLQGYTDRMIEGLIEANLALRGDEDGMKKYLALGDDGETLYAVHKSSKKKFHVIDIPDSSVVDKYADCGALFAAALQDHRL
jgi:hypothetical protein